MYASSEPAFFAGRLETVRLDLDVSKLAVNRFCPDGYVRTQMAIAGGAECWFPERFAALENSFAELESAVAPQPKSDSSLDAVVRAFSHRPIPAAWQDDTWRHEFEDLWSQTAHRLRNFLYQDTLKAYYFNDFGCHHLSREFWATAQADGVIESGTYWPFGPPTHSFEQRPNHTLFFKQVDLDALMSDQPAKKRPLPNRNCRSLLRLCAARATSRTVRNSAMRCASWRSLSGITSPTPCFAKLRGRCRATPVASLPILSNNIPATIAAIIVAQKFARHDCQYFWRRRGGPRLRHCGHGPKINRDSNRADKRGAKSSRAMIANIFGQRPTLKNVYGLSSNKPSGRNRHSKSSRLRT